MSLGLDLGRQTIKAVELTQGRAKPVLKNCGVIGHNFGGIENFKDEKSIANYAGTIKKLLNDAKIREKNVSISIPEYEVFTRTIKFPMLSEQEISAAIKWEAEEYIPMPVAEAIIEHQIIEKVDTGSGQEVLVLLVAVPKSTVEQYIKVASVAGLNVVGVDTAMISSSRSLSIGLQEDVIIVDMGNHSTDIAIAKNGQLALSRSFPTAGAAFTRAVAQTLNSNEVQAEEYKKTYGLDPTQLEGKIEKALTPIFKVVSDEVKKSMHYFQSETNGQMPASLLLVGGSAGLPGVIPAFSRMLNIEVSVGNPFQSIEVDKEKSETLKNFMPLYSQAAGLALRFD